MAEIPRPDADTHNNPSAVYLAGRDAFVRGLSLDEGINATPDDFDVDLAEFERGWNDAKREAGAHLPELADDRRIANQLDIAERETREVLAAAKQGHRQWMLEHAGHGGDAIKAADLRLRALNGLPGNTVRARALIVWSAVSIRDEAREDRGDVPTMDAPSGDVTSKKDRKKGRKGAKSSTGPKKSKRSVAFVKRIGSGGAGFKAGVAPDDARLLEALRAGAFRRRAEEIKRDPAWGLCLLTDPTAEISELPSLPSLGSDPLYVVFGLRRDAKTGCPTHRFRYDAERQATEEALAEGKQNATTQRIKEITENLVDRWYAMATPQTTVFPLVWCRDTSTLQVFSDNADAQSQAAGLLGQTLGALVRTPAHIDGMPAELHCTDLRSSDGAAKGSADVAADLLLWLVGRTMGGTGATRIEDGTLEWWLDEAVELERNTADEKKLRVKLSGAPAEGGSLAAALADGGTLRSARITLKLGEERWKLTLGAGGVVKGWTLPVLTKPDGTREGLDAAVDERIRLWVRGEMLLSQLVTAYRTERIDRGNWRQRVAAVQREVIKGIDHARERFIQASGQVSMFAEQIAEHVEARNAETSRARGRKARDEAAAVDGAP